MVEEVGSGGEEILLQPLDTLPEYLPLGFSDMTILVIPSDEFNTGSQYNITLTVKNFLNLTDTVTMTMTKLASPAPNMYVQGDARRIVSARAAVILEGTAEVPGCLGLQQDDIEYRWSVREENGDVVPVGEASLLKPTLYLPPSTLSPGRTYMVTFVAIVDDAGSDTSIVLHTLSTDVVAAVYGGSAITYGIDDVIPLDATQSSGITSELASSKSFIIGWGCTKMGSSAPCIDANGSVVALERELRTSILPYTLASGTYRITLNLTYNSVLLSTATQMVHIIDGINGPLVALDRPHGTLSIPTHRQFRLDGSIYSAHPGRVEWTCVYSPGK